MGYYTNYELSYDLPQDDQSETTKKFIEDCRKKRVSIPTELRVTFDENLSLEVELEKVFDEDTPSGYGPWKYFVNGGADQCKWYDHDVDMKWLSEKFPRVLFTLKGEGEESGDIWIKYYKGGKCQECRAEIVFPEYDEALLK